MLRTLPAILGLLILLAVPLPASPIAAQVQPEQLPSLLIEPSSGAVLPFSDATKFPSIDTYNGTVQVASNADERYAAYWSKPDSSTALPIFGDRTVIGEARGQADYTTASLTVANDGTIYMVWADLSDDGENTRVLLRRKGIASDWEPERQVIGFEGFHVTPDVGISSDNVLFVVWREPEKPIQARVSYNGGISWVSGTFDVGPQVARGAPQIATGPAGQVLVAYDSADGRIYVSQWTGSGFESRQVSSGDFADEADFFGHSDPSVAIAPDGRAYAAWRTSNAVIYAERQDDGSWPNAILSVADNGEVRTRVAITVDELNNLHIIWLARFQATFDLFYAYKTPVENWQGPVQVVSSGGAIFNPDAAANISTAAYAHAVVERFPGSGPQAIGYYLFDTPVINVLSAQPLIANGAAITNQSVVDVAFTAVEGSPTEVRWRWQAPPTDAANDSGGWQPFASTLSVPIPATLISPNCTELTLYTQVRRSNTVQDGSNADAVILDTGVQATVALRNPRVGDPQYTNNQDALLQVSGNGECSGPLSVTTLGQSYGTDANNNLTQLLPLPSAAPVPQNISIGLRDQLGNPLMVNQTMINDPIAPTFVTSGTLEVQADPMATVLLDLMVSGTVLSDTIYPEPHAWGIDIAISTTLTSSTALNWQTLPLPALTQNVSPSNSLNFSQPWSLANSLPNIAERPCAGDCIFYAYLRFRDGAGNPTPTALVRRFELEAISFPRDYLPLVNR